MRQFNKFRGTKGFLSLWERMIRFRYMISKEAERRTKILSVWEKHGYEAVKDVFGISERTLFRWQKLLIEGKGKLESLNPKSKDPKKKRKRIIPKPVEDLILKERAMEKIGKEKLSVLIKEDGIGTQSASTVGRMLADLKRKGKLQNPSQISFFGKTGRFIEKKPRKIRKKLRSKGHEGALAKADTIVRFTNGVKRYILTGIDLETEFAFAYAYASHSSKTAADFMKTFKSVAPVSLTHVQTDNGSEFADHFESFCDNEGIVHFHSYPRSPKMNAEIERFNRTLSEAFIQKNRTLLAYDLEAFNRALMDWLIWYNTRRPHWSLGLISPLRYIVKKLPEENCHMLWTSTKN